MESEDFVGWHSKGCELEKQGRYEEALMAYGRALELDTNRAFAWNDKGALLNKLGRFAEALEVFNTAIGIDETYVHAWNNKGNALLKLDHYEQALESYGRAIKLDQTYTYAWNGMGNALLKLDHYEQALDSFGRAIKLDQTYTYAWDGMANALMKLGRNDEALAALEQSILLDQTNANAWNTKGNILSSSGDFEESLKAYDRAVVLDAKCFGFWINKGNALRSSERFDEALEAYNRGIALDRKSPTPWYSKGNVFDELDRFDEALEAYKRAIALGKNDSYSLCGKGNALLGLGHFEDALATFNEALDLDLSKANPFPWEGKGEALWRLGRLDEALEVYEHAIELDGANPYYWKGVGNVLWDVPRLVEARQAYKRFCFLANPKDILRCFNVPLKVFYQSSYQAPLLLLRLLTQTPELLVKPGWFDTVRDLKQAYAAPLACLEALNATSNDMPDQLRLRAAGCLAFHLGDSMVAEKYFDGLDDHFPEDLLGQYYLASCRYDYCADISACLPDAVEAAKSYHGNDPEQHYYAARILAFADKKLESLTALQNSGDYAPALLLRFDMAKEQGDAPAMKELAKRFLEVERATPAEWRLLHPTPPEDFDFSSQNWLAVVLHYAKQQELMGEIQAFLEEMDEPPFFEQRHTYADVLLVTHTGAWDLKTAWNLDATSQAFIDGLMAERDEAALADLHAELKFVSVPFGEIDACPDDKLEARLAIRLEEDKVSFKTERRLNVYLYKKQRLTLQASFTLMLFSLVKEGRKSPEDIKSALFDAYLAIASGGAALVLGPIIPAALGAALGTGAFAGIASFVWHYRDSRKKAAHEAAVHDLDYRAFKSDLKTFLKEKQLDLPEAFWK